MACGFRRLPQELFENIVGLAILASPVHTAVRWRLVDRRFRDSIEPLLLLTGRLLHEPRDSAYASRDVWSLDLATSLVERELDNTKLIDPDLRHCIRLLEARLTSLLQLLGKDDGNDDDAATAVRRGICSMLVRSSELHLGFPPSSCMILYLGRAFYDRDCPDDETGNTMPPWLTLTEADVRELGLGLDYPADYWTQKDKWLGFWCVDAAALIVAALGLGRNEPLRHLCLLDQYPDLLTSRSMFRPGQALAAAAEVGNIDALGILLPMCTTITRRRGGNPAIARKLINTAARVAALYGHLSIVDELLHYAIQRGILVAQHETDDVASHSSTKDVRLELVLNHCFIWACRGGQIEVARDLLGRIPNNERALVDVPGTTKTTMHTRLATEALREVTKEHQPNIAIVGYLLSQGASLRGEFIRKRSRIESVDRSASQFALAWTHNTKNQALPRAISFGHLQVVKILLQQEATTDHQELMLACRKPIRCGDSSMVQLLFEGGALRVLLTEEEGEHGGEDGALGRHTFSTLFFWCLGKWSLQVYQVLLAWDLAHNGGRTALKALREPGQDALPLRHAHHVRPLLEAGLLRRGSDDAVLALHMALHAADMDTVCLLLADGTSDANAEMVYDSYEPGGPPGPVGPEFVQVCTPLARIEMCIAELQEAALQPYRRSFERLAEMLKADGGVSRTTKTPQRSELKGKPRYFRGGVIFYCGATGSERCRGCKMESWRGK